MKTNYFNNNFSAPIATDKDILAVFNQDAEKSKTIRQGMSVQEISEIVSDRVIAVVKEQFEATKKEFQKKEENN